VDSINLEKIDILDFDYELMVKPYMDLWLKSEGVQ
jgi:hypothetical protein